MDTTPGHSVSDGAGVVDNIETMRHLPLQNAVCVLCRFPIWLNENIAAVLGGYETHSYSAFTFCFKLPEHGHPFKYVAVHEKTRSLLWRLCRYQTCGHCRKADDAALYHVDCYKMVAKHFKRLRLWDIWTISIWSQPFPKAQYHSWPGSSTAIFSNVGPTLEELAAHIARLPEELRKDIVRACNRHIYARLLTALHRRSLFSSLLDEYHIEQEIAFPEIASWDRTNRLVRGDSGHKWVRIQLDDLGAASLETLTTKPKNSPAEPCLNRGYVVENLPRLKDSTIRLKASNTSLSYPHGANTEKGQYLRISTKDALQIWDTPQPPTTTISWYSKDLPPIFVRSIMTEDLTGVTAFCHGGSVHWIHPHYAGEDKTDAPFPSQEDFHPSERVEYTPIFYPLAPDECVESVWVRYRGNRNNRADITLVLVTDFGRPLVMGKYVHPSHAGVTFAPVQLNIGRHLLLPRHDPTFSDRNFAVVAPGPGGEGGSMMVPQHLARALYPPLEPDDMLYLSVAPFMNIRQITLFYKTTSEESGRQYTGIIFEYNDSAFESVGSCYGWQHSEVVSHPVEIFVFHETGRMNLALRPSTEWKVQIQDRPQSHKIALGDTLLWWFDDGGVRMVESQTRAQAAPHQ